MVKFSLFFCAFAVWAVAVVNCAESCHHVHTHTHAPAPAPSVDCSTLIFDMVDCLPFVTNGSKLSKPQGTCCAGLKTVLKTDGLCICEVFNSSSQFGVVFNITKAKTLPAACGVSAPSISKCGLPSVAPGAAPAHPPKSPSPSPSPKSPKSPAPSKPVAPAPTPASSSPGSIVAQAPAPGSGASSASISLVALLVSLVVATCSYF